MFLLHKVIKPCSVGIEKCLEGFNPPIDHEMLVR